MFAVFCGIIVKQTTVSHHITASFHHESHDAIIIDLKTAIYPVEVFAKRECMIDAILIMMKQPTQNLCTQVAQLYGKSEPSIERAMQNAINRAWKMSSINDLLTHYTAKINSAKGSPTITEFICYYANKLRNEY